MFGTTCKILALVAATTLIGTAGVSVVATAHGVGGHPAGHAVHDAHGRGHHERMAALIEELDLTPDQRARLDRIHELLAEGGGGHADMTAALHERLVAQFEAGPLDAADVRRVVDLHLERMRAVAYEVTDELVALVNGLDERQRGILHEHLAGMEGDVR